MYRIATVVERATRQNVMKNNYRQGQVVQEERRSQEKGRTESQGHGQGKRAPHVSCSVESRKSKEASNRNREDYES